MPRFFFDIHRPSGLTRDHIGGIYAGRDDVRQAAMEALPAIARDAIPRDGDRQAFTVLVRDEANVTVYTAALTFAGLWLGDSPIPEAEPLD